MCTSSGLSISFEEDVQSLKVGGGVRCENQRCESRRGSGGLPRHENLKFRCLEMLFSAFSSPTFEMDVLHYFGVIFPLFLSFMSKVT